MWKPKKQGSQRVSPIPSLNAQMKVKVLLSSVMSDSATPWTVACQAPLSMGSSRQEWYRGCLSFPSPGYLHDSGTEPRSPALQADSLLSEPQGKPPRTRHKRVSAGGDGYPSSSRQQIFNFSAFSFYSSSQWIGLWLPHLRGRSSLLHLLV